MNISNLITRRENSYNRAVAATAAVIAETEAYKKANDGFVSYDLVNKADKIMAAQSKKFALLSKAENYAA